MTPEGYAATMDFETTGFSDGMTPMQFKGSGNAEGGPIVDGKYLQDPDTLYETNFKEAEWPEVVENHYDPTVEAFEEILAEQMMRSDQMNKPVEPSEPVQLIHPAPVVKIPEQECPIIFEGTVASVKVVESLPMKIFHDVQDFLKRIFFV